MPNYINNKDFFNALKKRKETGYETGEKQPVDNYLGKCFLDIATNLAQKKNFANYTFVDIVIILTQVVQLHLFPILLK